MRPLIFIARVFPPAAGGGVQRPLKLAKHLVRHGYAARVIAGRPTGALDPSLLDELPPEVRVFRVPLSTTERSRQLLRFLGLGRVHRWAWKALFLGDDGMADLAETVMTALVHGREAEAVLATSLPFSSVIAGALVARILRVPLLADLRDPWAFAPRPRFMLPRQLEVAQELERWALSEAKAITMVTEPMRAYLPPSVAALAEVAPNGYDPDDFGGAVEPKRPEVFRVVYAGSLYGSRRPDAVLEALRAFLPSASAAGRKLEIVLAGSTHEHEATLRDSGLPIELRGYLPHREATALLRSADAILVIVGVEEADRHAPSGKLYEAIAAGPPVLAWACTDGEAARVLSSTQAGRAVERSADLAEALRAVLEQRAPVAPLVARDLIPYQRQTTARQIAEILDRITG
ncbi:MAG: glycosyltransferase [Myxococcota bacterium]